MKNALFLFLLSFTLVSLKAQQELPLYHSVIPNSRQVPDPERIVERETGGRSVHDTAVPTLTVFAPPHPNGKAVIICPGGGYVKTAIDKEGFLVAQSLLEDSITAFVLKYRIPQDLTNIDKSLAPLQDAQQAIRYVRKNAVTYQLDTDKIGIMGFSAGGHLASSAATHFRKPADSNERDTTSFRPDFVILIYPVISFTDELAHRGSRGYLLGPNPTAAEILEWSNEEQVNALSPPAFLVHAADDKSVSVGNSLAYYSACVRHGVPAEMHLYPQGGHGFGIYNTTTPDDWMERLKNWISTL